EVYRILERSHVDLKNYPRTQSGSREERTAQGNRVELPDAAGSGTAYPGTLVAYRGTDGGLNLSVVHDRGRLSDAQAERLAANCAQVLSELPDTDDERTTVADILESIGEETVPRMAPPPWTGPAETS